MKKSTKKPIIKLEAEPGKITVCAASTFPLDFRILRSLADEDDLDSLNQRIHKLFAEGEFQEAIPLTEKGR